MNLSLDSPRGQLALKTSLKRWQLIRSAAEKLSCDSESPLTPDEEFNIYELDFESPVCKEISFLARSEDDREEFKTMMFPPDVCVRCPVREDYLKTGECPEADVVLCCVDYDVMYGLIGGKGMGTYFPKKKYERALPYIDSVMEKLQGLVREETQ